MEFSSKWTLSPVDKKKYIAAFVPHLPVLRAKAGISQEELSTLIGITRQTYSAVERGSRELTWNTFLSLILFFDYNQDTHQMLHSSGAFPTELLRVLNGVTDAEDVALSSIIGDGKDDIMSVLDEQAKQSLRNMLMLEYARCTQTPGDVVIRAFDGKKFHLTPQNEQAEIALKMIKDGKKDRK